MKQPSVPVLVLSARRDDAELVNRTLREAGHRAKCQWQPKADKFAESIAIVDPQLIFVFADSIEADIGDLSRKRQQHVTPVPLLVIAETVDEDVITSALHAGAQDMISTSQRERLKAVATRELRTYRLERALNRTLESASQYKAQLKSIMSGSVDAIAQIQEGIVVDANPAWAELLGHEAPEATHGPIMDFIHAGSQAALKGALLASMKGKWDGTPLRVEALRKDGRRAAIELSLEQALFDGDPSVKITVKRAAEQAEEPEEIVERSVQTDPVTGMTNRARFLELLQQRLGERKGAGSRALALIRIDKFREIQDEIGPVAGEEVIAQTGNTIRGLLGKHDVAGRFAGTTFAVILERGTLRDVQAWAEHVIERIAENMIEAAGKSITVTCTMGIAEFGPDMAYVEPLIRTAEHATRRGRETGGDRVVIEETSDVTTQIKRLDALWVHQIKSALMENRFRLVHLGIASLSGPSMKMMDTVLRMIDQQGDEVSAAEFMQSARRNGLARPVDRWVIGASIDFCSSHECDLCFIKLSDESISDEELVDWMTKYCSEKRVETRRICIQISETDAAQLLKQTQTITGKLRAAGFRFAIEHFGTGRDPMRILNQLPADYIKIDGSLMQSVASSAEAQERVKAFIAAARLKKVGTIAERVDDANTMAVLFQLGIAYMQGHYVHEPEVVLGESA